MSSRIMSGLTIVLLALFTFSAVVAKGSRKSPSTPGPISVATEASTKEAALHDAFSGAPPSALIPLSMPATRLSKASLIAVFWTLTGAGMLTLSFCVAL